MKVIAQLEFELTYFKTSVQRISHYTMGLLPDNLMIYEI